MEKNTRKAKLKTLNIRKSASKKQRASFEKATGVPYSLRVKNLEAGVTEW